MEDDTDHDDSRVNVFIAELDKTIEQFQNVIAQFRQLQQAAVGLLPNPRQKPKEAKLTVVTDISAEEEDRVSTTAASSVETAPDKSFPIGVMTRSQKALIFDAVQLKPRSRLGEIAEDDDECDASDDENMTVHDEEACIVVIERLNLDGETCLSLVTKNEYLTSPGRIDADLDIDDESDREIDRLLKLGDADILAAVSGTTSQDNQSIRNKAELEKIEVSTSQSSSEGAGSDNMSDDLNNDVESPCLENNLITGLNNNNLNDIEEAARNFLFDMVDNDDGCVDESSLPSLPADLEVEKPEDAHKADNSEDAVDADDAEAKQVNNCYTDEGSDDESENAKPRYKEKLLTAALHLSDKDTDNSDSEVDAADIVEEKTEGRRITRSSRKKSPLVLLSASSESTCSDSEAESSLISFSSKESSSITKKKKRKRRKLRSSSFDSTGSDGYIKRKQARLEKMEFLKTVQLEHQDGDNDKKSLILDYEAKTKQPIVQVDHRLLQYSKSHQCDGVRFMFDCCYTSIEKANVDPGSGCILAHCMGLGKTYQVIVFLHTLMKNDHLTVRQAMCIVPKNTLMNWIAELYKWQFALPKDEHVKVHDLCDTHSLKSRLTILRRWKQDKGGSVLLIGYDQLRRMTTSKDLPKDKMEELRELLVDPGPDILVCDEGHVLKNDKTSIYKCIAEIKTRRKILLTGTPLQNNLDEYHCMMSLINPKLLGNYKKFKTQFVVPITGGLLADATEFDVKLMKRRVHVLHNMLDDCVQRKDFSCLYNMLPPKYEYVLHVRLSAMQIKMYRGYLSNKVDVQNNYLFRDYTVMQKILLHPWVCREYCEDDVASDGLCGDEESDEAGTVSHDSKEDDEKDKDNGKQNNSSSKISEWFRDVVSDLDQYNESLSGKILLTFKILDRCSRLGDKLILFSQSLIALDYIEKILKVRDIKAREQEDESALRWVKNVDFCRIDGGIRVKDRDRLINSFNDTENTRLRFFLISTKSGGIGINLIAANRVIMFDVSWNPAHDIQAIFRSYRIGQSRPVYVYRLVAQGSMEETIYQRQVNKECLVLHVCDEQQIQRHFTQADIKEFYRFFPVEWDPEAERETPILPKDHLLADLLKSYPEWIVNYHEHDSLLQRQLDQDLTEEERSAAWKEYEEEQKMYTNPPPVAIPLSNYPTEMFSAGYRDYWLETLRHDMPYQQRLNTMNPLPSFRFRANQNAIPNASSTRHPVGMTPNVTRIPVISEDLSDQPRYRMTFAPAVFRSARQNAVSPRSPFSVSSNSHQQQQQQQSSRRNRRQATDTSSKTTPIDTINLVD